MEREKLTMQGDPDWDNRVLCSDGRCTGVIGPDGRCGECGAGYEDFSPDVISSVGKGAELSVAVNTGTTGKLPLPEPDRDTMGDDRVLCRDGRCTGIIGPDGRCGECRLPLIEG